MLFFILASSKLTAENIYYRDNLGFGSRSQNNFSSPGSATQLFTILFLINVRVQEFRIRIWNTNPDPGTVLKKIVNC